MIDVSRHALVSGVCDDKVWNYRLARGLIYKSAYRKGEDKVKDLFEASEKLSSDLKSLDQLTRKVRLDEIFELNNYICKLVSVKKGERFSSFDIVSRLIERGDVRVVLFDFCHRLLADERGGVIKPNQVSAYNARVEKLNHLIRDRTKGRSSSGMMGNYFLDVI
ncbi:hypothetical protein [Halomonas alkalicola]|uniref:Uncharacterized protein n=2 Tax=Halomonas alkalicola TaxID=1930622 RepID=A0ABY9H2X9_9GAMM|nr:hypothetical protein [Halomonas alkalicola]WLI72685.1 hypothetical protein B6N23_13090 [Halomonas alkalicola]